jgi:hypothetical protein
MPAVTEKNSTAAEKLARDARIAHQKKLAELATVKNNGSTVIQNNTNPGGRRPVWNQRRAQLPQGPEIVKKHDAYAAREYAAAESKKRNEAKDKVKFDARLMAQSLRLKRARDAEVAANQTRSTSAADGEDSQSVDAEGDINMPDSDTALVAPKYDFIAGTNSTTIHNHMTVNQSSGASEIVVKTSPAVAMYPEAASTDDDEDCPVFAFGPAPEQTTGLSSVSHDDSDTTNEAVIEVAEKMLAFRP